MFIHGVAVEPPAWLLPKAGGMLSRHLEATPPHPSPEGAVPSLGQGLSTQPRGVQGRGWVTWICSSRQGKAWTFLWPPAPGLSG